MIYDNDMSAPPIRCFTCNHMLADKYVKYKELLYEKAKAMDIDVEKNNSAMIASTIPNTEMHSICNQSLNELGISNICCRAQTMTTVDMSCQRPL